MYAPIPPQRSSWARAAARLICLVVLCSAMARSAEPVAPRPAGDSTSLPHLNQVDGTLRPLSLDDTGRAAPFDARLIGFWRHRGRSGEITLEFLSENRLVFAGHDLRYEMRPGAIHVEDSTGGFDYSYRFDADADQLYLSFNDDGRENHELRFIRVPDITSSSRAK